MVKKTLILVVALIMYVGLFAGCTPKSEGTFYSLEEAFEQEFLTQEDLKNIAHYYNGGNEGNEEIMGDDFVPIFKSPEALNSEIEKKIKTTYLTEVKRDNLFAKLKNILILDYYGIYNNCVIVMMGDNIRTIDILFLPEYIIEGVVFRDYNPILVWRENTFL